MRAIALVAGIALFYACGEQEPETPCCAIVPKAKCEGALMGLGVTPKEMAIIMSGDRICPSIDLDAERLRELDAQWPAACREAGTMSPAYAMTSGFCAASAATPGSLDDYTPPEGVDAATAEACATGLASRGLKENEIWLMVQTPDGVCPNVGVDEPRIRAIIANDWEAAGCKQFTKEQMLHALDSGACGGDAG